MIRIGNAPVSYGAFEVTVGHDDDVPSAAEVLDAVASAGYEGIDLGPLGYLGLGADLREALASRNLALAGGYVEVDVSSDDAPERGLGELDQVMEQFDAAAEASGGDACFLPRPTVALIKPEGAAPAGDSRAGWARIVRVVEEVVRRCEQRGYEACLHNEVGTELAAQARIERVLEQTGARLCLDTGHLLAAGGDALELLGRFADRVTHVHLKDAHVETGAPPYLDAMDLWRDSVFCRLGDGSSPVDAVLERLRAAGYEGWILVEQDVLPKGKAAYDRARDDQVANRRFLAERGL